MQCDRKSKRMDPKMYNPLSLAFLGDAVYGAMVRKHLLTQGIMSAKRLHDCAIGYVSAPAQYDITRLFPEILTEEEYQIFKRGRNAESGHQPKHGTIQEYHAATGLETLFGYLELKEDWQRMKEIFNKIIVYVEGKNEVARG